MAVVLGIDAAWTARNDSGFAVARCGPAGWRLLAAASSHAEFLRADGPPTARTLLERTETLAGAPADLVAVDMPLSLDPITRRRAADDQVSAAYGARKAGTHSPGPQRPGAVADRMRADFAAAGYALRTLTTQGRLAEVYPHPALIELLGAAERLPYKVSRAGKYWPGAAPAERRARLLDVWRGIVAGLDLHLPGTMAMLPLPLPEARTADLKRFEDRLDAVICAVAGIAVLEGKARAFGDDRAAIWVPRPAETA